MQLILSFRLGRIDYPNAITSANATEPLPVLTPVFCSIDPQTPLTCRSLFWGTTDRRTRRCVAWVVGGRDAHTFRRLYAKAQHLSSCYFFTDDWDAFAVVLPAQRHRVGKTHTVAIEQDNSNTRHDLGRFTRRTKIVSQQDRMIDLSLRLWHALSQPQIFAQYQKIAMTIYK